MALLHSLALVLLSYAVFEVRAQCPDGFQQFQQNCYIAPGLEASWIEARAYCKVLGAHLAMVETAAEESIIEGILAGQHGTHIDEEYWLSGSDIATEKNWRWMAADGTSVPMTTYTNWGSGQPDDNGHHEDCLLLHYRSGRTHWNDDTCSNLHSFICEIGYA